MFWILVGTVIAIIGYFIINYPYNYWTKKGVDAGSRLTLLKGAFQRLIRTQSLAEFVQDVYNKTPNTRYTGAHMLVFPILVIRDPDLIKQMTIKDFEHFADHVSVASPEGDPIWSNNLFALKGQKWRKMRSTLSPAFTGSKMRYMFNLISQNAQQFVNYFVNRNEEVITVELKETFTRFTNDVIANTAFGVEINSLVEPNNEFYQMGKIVTNFRKLGFMLKVFGYFVFPSLYKVLKVTFFPKKVTDFFQNLITQNVESREKHGIVRPDMINVLLEARRNGVKYEENKSVDNTGFATVEESEIGRKGQTVEITNDIIISQAMIFFIAGYDAASSLTCFMGYELAVNQDVQERLRQEICDTFQTCNGKVTYEALMEMKYLDMVVSETLRKWPASPTIDRECSKDYIIEPKLPHEKPVLVKKGDGIWLPFFGIHRDPRNYPDPDKFDPERFSDENKHKIKPYTFIPFGVGPRNCVGSRFALLETKILSFYLLLNFEIVPVGKSQIPLKLDTKTFNLHSQGGFWFGLKKRVQSDLK